VVQWEVVPCPLWALQDILQEMILRSRPRLMVLQAARAVQVVLWAVQVQQLATAFSWDQVG
jgi:hypothetical protein